MEYLTVKAAAEALHVNEKKVRNLILLKRLPYSKAQLPEKGARRRVVISSEDLTKFLELARQPMPVINPVAMVTPEEARGNGGLRRTMCLLCRRQY